MINLPFAKESEIPPEVREKRADELTYINNMSQTVKGLYAHSAELTQKTEEIQQRSNAIAKRIDQSNQKYTRLNAAIQRLDKLFDTIPQTTTDLENAWKSLVEVENRLKKLPKYASLNSGIDIDDLLK